MPDPSIRIWHRSPKCCKFANSSAKRKTETENSEFVNSRIQNSVGLLMTELYYGSGKRKSAVARTWLKPGKGNITINNRSIDDYFVRESAKMIVEQPLVLTDTAGAFEVKVNVSGGGISGQAAAIRHGIANALLQVNPEFRPILKKAGLVRRDSRIKERKKYGQRGARARFQYSKR